MERRESDIFLHTKLNDLDYVITRLRRQDLKSLIEKYLPKGGKAVVLDFGAGKAPYESMFAGRVETFLAANFSSGTEKYEFDVEINPEGRLKYPPESVDVVLSLQVLEHVADVERYLSEAKRVLKPGGLLWLTTHGIWSYHPIPTDYRRWTSTGLRLEIDKYFKFIEDKALMGAPAYAFKIYLHLLWLLCSKLNKLQARIMNTLAGYKEARSGRKMSCFIKNPYPYLFIGTILFSAVAIPTHLVMALVDYLTPYRIKVNQGVVFRIVAQKDDNVK